MTCIVFKEGFGYGEKAVKAVDFKKNYGIFAPT